jgi:hypothetical protein
VSCGERPGHQRAFGFHRITVTGSPVYHPRHHDRGECRLGCGPKNATSQVTMYSQSLSRRATYEDWDTRNTGGL